MLTRNIGAAVGNGLLAGLVGTAAMTLFSTLEMKLTGRSASDAPSKVAGKVLGVQPRNEDGRRRFTSAVHWGYGAAWGIARGLLSSAGVRGPGASALHFAAVWGAALIMLPAAGQAPPATDWDAERLATDGLHHAVYAAATGAAYEFIDGH